MGKTIRIGVDLISGESAIDELVHGCIDGVEAVPDIEVIMIGKGDIYRPLLQNKRLIIKKKSIQRISILEASEIITMEDDPLTVIKQKKDSSIVRGLQAHKAGEIDGFFSPGNTGAIVVAASLIMGRIKGVKKPALAAFIPNVVGSANLVLDVGASAECESDDLIKFAAMGKIYIQELLGINNPRIGLLNIGEESHKGTSTAKATYKRLSEMDINFIGNIEGDQLFSDDVDVVVCDGYIGNIGLKIAEGAGKAVSTILKSAVKKSISATLSFVFYKGAIKTLKKTMDPEGHGGAPLLGVNGNIFIGHGKSGREAVKCGIINAANAVRSDILGKINRKIEELHLTESQ